MVCGQLGAISSNDATAKPWNLTNLPEILNKLDCFRVAARHALVRLAVAMDDTQLAQPHRPGIGAAFYCFAASRVLSARPPDSAC